MVASKLAFAFVGLSLLSVASVACGPSEPPKMAPAKTDGVAANSASEERLAGTASAKPAPAPAPSNDPAAAQPYMTPMNAATGGSSSGGAAAAAGANGGGAGAGSTGSTSSASTKAGKGGKGAKGGAAAGGEKASAAECKQAMDRAIDLMISSDPRFAGIPPEMLAQIKSQGLTQAAGQAGDPCAKGEMTKAQYSCTMSASSGAAAQACLK